LQLRAANFQLLLPQIDRQLEKRDAYIEGYFADEVDLSVYDKTEADDDGWKIATNAQVHPAFGPFGQLGPLSLPRPKPKRLFIDLDGDRTSLSFLSFVIGYGGCDYGQNDEYQHGTHDFSSCFIRFKYVRIKLL
jgi:hypothetical protein